MSETPDIAAAAVVYAKDVARVAAFYRHVVGFEVTDTAPDHVTLTSRGYQLVIVRIPDEIAAGIDITDPPVRREDTAIKLVFPVGSIDAARKAALGFGGEVNPPERVWTFDGWAVCDGHDPEGNVLQFREPA